MTKFYEYCFEGKVPILCLETNPIGVLQHVHLFCEGNHLLVYVHVSMCCFCTIMVPSRSVSGKSFLGSFGLGYIWS